MAELPELIDESNQTAETLGYRRSTLCDTAKRGIRTEGLLNYT